MVPIEVETGTRVKKFTHQSDGSFAMFKYEVAEILGCPTSELSIGYLTPDMKAPSGRKLFPRSLDTIDEYDDMIKSATEFLEAQRKEEINMRQTESKAMEKKSKGKSKVGDPGKKPGRPSQPKAPIKYVVTIVPDTSAETKSKNAKVSLKLIIFQT